MSQHTVNSSGKLPVSADHAWSLVRDFCDPWHPAIATMATEYSTTGAKIRAFTVHGDDAVYREQLTWFSDSERSMAYTHIEGIEGVDDYKAQLFIEENDENNCTVTLSATLAAPEPRATPIASGTQAIFDDAIAAIKILVKKEAPSLKATHIKQSHNTPRTTQITGSPKLTISTIDESNTGSDTLCLFLHGIGGNRSNWDGQLAALAPYCTVASLDLRGYGDSEPGETQSTVDDYCDDILRVAKSFNKTKLVLCGLSYGAWIATSFAVRYPDQLAALGLSGGCTGMSEAGEAEREAFRHSREKPLSEGQTPADFAQGVVSILAGPDITDTVKEELLASMCAISSATYADALRCFTNPKETFDFANLTMPVLLMTGDADKLAPPHEIKHVAERIYAATANPDVRYECLARAGHLCNLEAPLNYNTPLIELVKRVSR